jgi:integrase
MAVVKDLDQAFVDHKLICPPGASKFEFVAPGGTGLYILVHASKPGQGTYFLRYRDPATGKTRHALLGKTADMSLDAAGAATAAFRATLGQSPAQPAAVSPAPPNAAATSSPASAGRDGEMTLDAFMTDLYFPHVKVHKRSWKRDDQLYRLRIKAKFGDRAMSSIARREVNQFKIALLGSGLSKASVNHHIQLLRHVFNLSVSWEILDRNVLTGIELLHLDNQVENYLDDEAVDRFMEVAKTDENRNVCMILIFLLSTGARLGEALSAQWAQVDREKRVWKIPATNSKSKKLKYLPINDGALWVLDQLGSEGKSPYVFPSPATGKPYTTITRAWYRIRQKAGIADNVRIHDLRHSFASRLLSRGRSLYEAQRLLGHADPRTTMRCAHMDMRVMHEASNSAALAVPDA